MTFSKHNAAALPAAALFDLDGVIIDTEGQYTHFWHAIGQKELPHIPTFAHDIKGCSLVQIFDKYFANAPEARQRTLDALNAFENEMAYTFIPGAMAHVEQLRTAGVPTAVVTSSNLAKMAHLYAAHPTFRAAFTRIFTAEDAGRSKPAPDCYLNAARALGVDIARCTVYEDSVNGLRAARAAGAHVVGLATSHPADVIRPLCDECWEGFKI